MQQFWLVSPHGYFLKGLLAKQEHFLDSNVNKATGTQTCQFAFKFLKSGIYTSKSIKVVLSRVDTETMANDTGCSSKVRRGVLNGPLLMGEKQGSTPRPQARAQGKREPEPGRAATHGDDTQNKNNADREKCATYTRYNRSAHSLLPP